MVVFQIIISVQSLQIIRDNYQKQSVEGFVSHGLHRYHISTKFTAMMQIFLWAISLLQRTTAEIQVDLEGLGVIQWTQIKDGNSVIIQPV